MHVYINETVEIWLEFGDVGLMSKSQGGGGGGFIELFTYDICCASGQGRALSIYLLMIPVVPVVSFQQFLSLSLTKSKDQIKFPDLDPIFKVKYRLRMLNPLPRHPNQNQNKTAFHWDNSKR